MRFRTLHRWIAVVCLAAASGYAPSAFAQADDAFCGPCCDFDTQWFAPVDFDFNCRPIKKDCGFFFNYNRLYWAATGERMTVGARGVSETAEVVFPGATIPLDPTGVTNAQADGNPIIGPYQIVNGIQNAPPKARFGWGDRFELGYRTESGDWTVGILDGPKIGSSAVYGFPQIAIPNSFPGTNDLPLLAGDLSSNGFSTGGDGVAVTSGGIIGGPGLSGSAPISTSHNGFGSVHVNFENGDQHLFGFRNYWNQTSGTFGPGYHVQSITLSNGLITDIVIRNLPDNSPGMPNVDNLDGDAIVGQGFILDTAGNIIASVTDFGDLAHFNIAFDTLYVNNYTQTDGVEIMRNWHLDNSHLPVKEQRNEFTFGAGARFFKMKDEFYWDGRGSILGRTYVDTVADNQIVGPQIRAAWTHQRKRWNLGLDGRCLFGYNQTDMSQVANFGEDLAPGQTNTLLYTQPTTSAVGKTRGYFSPLAELRAEARYQVTGALALKLGYTGIFVDNVTRASQIVRYRIPDMGIRGGGEQNILINGVDFGIELVH